MPLFAQQLKMFIRIIAAAIDSNAGQLAIEVPLTNLRRTPRKCGNSCKYTHMYVHTYELYLPS